MGKDAVQLIDVTTGLWLWRMHHPGWKPDDDWEPEVACTCVHSGGEILLLDPLRPASAATAIWERLDAQAPTAAVVLKPDHVRDVDYFVERYRIPAFGPSLFWPDDIPRTRLEPIEPGSKLPGGVSALYDGRGKQETPLWLPEQQALVFADGLTSQGGVLRVWATPWHQERVVPALTKLLDLPFKHVIVSHGEPVQTRAAYERALMLPPWES